MDQVDRPRGVQAAQIQTRTVPGSELERRNSTPTRRIHDLRQRPGQNSNVSFRTNDFLNLQNLPPLVNLTKLVQKSGKFANIWNDVEIVLDSLG